MTALERARIIGLLAEAHYNLVESGAADDLIAGVSYWLRMSSREGMTDADLEHAIEAASVTPLSRKA